MRSRRSNATGAAILAGLLMTTAAAKPGPAPVPRPKAARPAAARAAPPSHPDFSGTWKLSMTRSSFGKTPGGKPRARTDVIKHHDPHLLQMLCLDLVTGRDTTVYRYLTDSTESVNRVERQEIKARVWWEGGVLSLDSRTRIMVLDATLKDRWSMSSDGKTLTMRRRIKSPLGEDEQVLVFEKQ